LAKLAQFRKKLEQAKVEVVTQEEKTSWLAHELKFVVDATKRVSPSNYFLSFQQHTKDCEITYKL